LIVPQTYEKTVFDENGEMILETFETSGTHRKNNLFIEIHLNTKIQNKSN